MDTHRSSRARRPDRGAATQLGRPAGPSDRRRTWSSGNAALTVKVGADVRNGGGRSARPSLRPGHFRRGFGTSNLSDRLHSPGYVESHVFSDEEDIYSYEKYRESSEVYLQRTTDIAVVEHGEALGVRTYIVMAPTIFGLRTGPFNRYSIQLPSMIASAIEHGEFGATSQSGTSPTYTKFAARHPYCRKVQHGRRGIYFSESGQHTHHEFSARLATTGKELGVLQTDKLRSVDLEEAGRQWSFGVASRTELAFAAK